MPIVNGKFVTTTKTGKESKPASEAVKEATVIPGVSDSYTWKEMVAKVTHPVEPAKK